MPQYKPLNRSGAAPARVQDANLTPDKKHEGTDILIAEKAPPHERVYSIISQHQCHLHA